MIMYRRRITALTCKLLLPITMKASMPRPALCLKMAAFRPEWYGSQDTSSYVKLLFWTALSYDNSGQYEKALPFYEESSSIYKTVMGPGNPKYAISINSLALI